MNYWRHLAHNAGRARDFWLAAALVLLHGLLPSIITHNCWTRAQQLVGPPRD